MSDELFREKILWTIIIVLVGFLGGNIIYGLSMWRNIGEQTAFFLSIVPLGIILVFRHRLIMNWKPNDYYLIRSKDSASSQKILDSSDIGEKENKELLKSLA